MWSTVSEPLVGRTGHRVRLLLDARAATFSEVLAGWREDAECRAEVLRSLAQAPYAGYFWEHPNVTRSTLEQPYEFVLLDAPSLASIRPEPGAFAEQFSGNDEGDGIATFPNLGNDAILVVPKPVANLEAYSHLAAFARHAPIDQQHALLRAIGHAMERRISDAPTWLSTAGLGVYWLHVRLDSRPKYYRFHDYR